MRDITLLYEQHEKCAAELKKSKEAIKEQNLSLEKYKSTIEKYQRIIHKFESDKSVTTNTGGPCSMYRDRDRVTSYTKELISNRTPANTMGAGS